MLALLIRSCWCNECNALNNLLDITIGVFLHATGTRGDPASHRGELAAVWLVARDDTAHSEISLQVLASDTSLDASNHVLLVDPEDFVHAAHVEADDHAICCAFIAIPQGQSLRDIRTSTVWNEDNIVRVGQSDDCLHVLCRSWVEDHIHISLETTIPEGEHFPETSSM